MRITIDQFLEALSRVGGNWHQTDYQCALRDHRGRCPIQAVAAAQGLSHPVAVELGIGLGLSPRDSLAVMRAADRAFDPVTGDTEETLTNLKVLRWKIEAAVGYSR